MRCCLYLRKSRADLELEAKGEMETLARHKKILLELAKSKNLTVTQIYEEIVSGETIEARPVVRQLLDEVEQGLWDGVLVMEIERLARGDTIDQGIVARAFKMGHTKIITPTKTYDPDNEFDEEYFEFGLFMSRREYKTINRRIQRGRIQSAKEGKFIGSTPPYGYKKVRIKNDKGYTLEPDENEAPVVKLIYKLYTEGQGMGRIARTLDDMAIKPRYRDTWSKSTINDILENPVYVGKLRWSYRKETKYMENGKLRKRRTINDNPIFVDGLHPPLVSEEIYNKAQEIRQKNTYKKTKIDLTLKNPLSGLVYCKKCNSMMTRLGISKKKNYDTLICPNRNCKNVSAPIFLIEEKIIMSLYLILLRMNTELELSKNNQKEKASLIEAHSKAITDIRREIEKTDMQINNTYDLLEQGVYSTEVFTARNKTLSERKQNFIKQLEELQSKLDEAKKKQKAELDIPKYIKLIKGYESLNTAEDKNRLLNEVLERVEYIKTKANTKGNLLNANFEIALFPRFAD